MMISLEKTLRFVQKTGLLIVPLAAAAIGHAGTIPAGAFTFGSLGAGSLLGVTSNGASETDGGTTTFMLSATGMLFGGSISSGATIPVSYDFDLGFANGSLGASISAWNLDFELLDGSTVIGDSGLITGSPDVSTAGQKYANSAVLTTSAGAAFGDTLTEQVTLNVSWNPGSGDQLVITVPQGSLFDAPVAHSIGTQGLGTPEPGTLGLTGSVLGMAAFYLRRRKRQSNG